MEKPALKTTASKIEVVYSAIESQPSDDAQKALDKAFAIVFDEVFKIRGAQTPPVLLPPPDRIIKPYSKDN